MQPIYFKINPFYLYMYVIFKFKISSSQPHPFTTKHNNQHHSTENMERTDTKPTFPNEHIRVKSFYFLSVSSSFTISI